MEEEMELEIVYYESTPVAVEIPTFVERQIEYTEPGLEEILLVRLWSQQD